MRRGEGREGGRGRRENERGGVGGGGGECARVSVCARTRACVCARENGRLHESLSGPLLDTEFTVRRACAQQHTHAIMELTRIAG